jgi:hypothetical protein
MKKCKSTSGFTVIDWDEIQKMSKIVIDSSQINRKKKLTYADILIISYIKGFGSNGFFGTYKKISKTLCMSENQVCKQICGIKSIKNIYNDATIFIEEKNTLYFNPYFLSSLKVRHKGINDLTALPF